MATPDSKVLIIGCGAAGVTAAIGLARRGIPVIVVEGGVFPGAENWSGAVYFCENLARPEILGEDLLQETPLERRVQRRSLLMTDGRVAPGLGLRSLEAFRHCYTVLRPVFDHDLAQKARLFGAQILNDTTVTSLIREAERVVGVMTDRGPLYADVVFLAEGDASHLVTREGLETVPKNASGIAQPEFLQGVKEVLSLPSDEIEKRFGLEPGRGACYEILLRNGMVDGRPLRLNAGAFLYTNRNSLSLGIVAPLANLAEYRGEYNRLMEWLKGLPALRPFLEGARTMSFGAKVIRGGGFKQMPRLVMDGLCVGGAASGIGVDFPYPNYTGPATFMGYAFSESVAELLGRGEAMSRENLEATYVHRLRESVYLKDVHHLREWPHFMGSAREFFGRQVDVVATGAHILTDGKGGVVSRHVLFARHLFEKLPPRRLLGFVSEMRSAGRALGFERGVGSDLLAALPWWIVNVVVGWFPRDAKVPADLALEMPDGRNEAARRAPLAVRWMLWRLGPGLKEALWHLYRNDGTPLEVKVPLMRRALLSRLSLLDFVLLPVLLCIVYLTGTLSAGWFRLRAILTRMPLDKIRALPFFRLAEQSRALTDLSAVPMAVGHDGKLALISYRSDPQTHIHFHAAYDEAGLPKNGGSPVFSVCPAKVYQEDVDKSLGTSVTVLHENCVRCETCWRADDVRVDWGRTRGHRLVYEAYTTADAWLIESQEAAARADIQRAADEMPRKQLALAPVTASPQTTEALGVVVAYQQAFMGLMAQLESVLTGADQTLLADVGQQVLIELDAVLASLAETDPRRSAGLRWREVAAERLRSRRFFQFETDLTLLRSHHLPAIGTAPALKVDDDADETQARRGALRALLEETLNRDVVRDCELAMGPTEVARHLLLRLAKQLMSDGGPARPGSLARDLALEELARLSPSMAVVLSRHLAACDALWRAEAGDRDLAALRQRTQDGSVLLALMETSANAFSDHAGEVSVTFDAVLLGGADLLVVLGEEVLLVFGPKDDGVTVEVVGALGLRGAGPGTLRIASAKARARFAIPHGQRSQRTRGAWDLVAVARGMGSYLFERALDHAGSRVQFPGLFKDLRGRDGLAKFGSVQAMLAGIAEGCEILEALRGRVGHGMTTAALAIDVLGCSPRSIAYLAGQVLGGTAFSEEDPVCRFYRDAGALSRIPYVTVTAMEFLGRRAFDSLHPGFPELPDLDLETRDIARVTPWTALVSDPIDQVRGAVMELTRAFRDVGAEERAALAFDLGRVTVQAAAFRALIDRHQATMERGEVCGLLVPVIEMFARRLRGRTLRLAQRVGDTERLVALGRMALVEGALEGPAGATGATYDDYLAEPQAFVSGDTVCRPGTSAELAYTPELLEADPILSQRLEATHSAFRARFREAGRRDGKTYTRRIDETHHLPDEDLGYLVDGGYFRMVIPEKYLGQGLRKSHYYIACAQMMREGDPAQALIVMGSTSIGTTPILIGLEEDLKDARASLGALLADGSQVDAIRSKLEELIARSQTPDVLKLGDDVKALGKEARKVLQSSKALKLVFQDFSSAFLRAGMAGMKRDLVGFRRGLERSLSALTGFRERLERELATLPSREAAHGFYLRLISSGRISAFALTEPSAGSDTARIRTRAEPTHVPVERDPRGFYTFVPEGGSERRNLFVYESFVFNEEGMFFEDTAGTKVPVHIVDFPKRHQCRYVVLEGERVDIHDLGAVHEVDGRLVYPYFRANGAKMWITNGSQAGVMVLYARTARGPTGFMLDAHAEGLVVGKDEEKMGQRGSATNELSLADVRIPVDQVIGIEGRGQENALETLNVGRAGLSFCVAGLMQETAKDLREALQGECPTPGQLFQIGKMVLDIAGSEALAYQLVGRFDHKGTESIRMESAIGKARVAEAYHRVLTRTERVLPAKYVLDHHELEKRRRDARVLTIYEGTNEIQRFLLLKDLVDVLDLERTKPLLEEGPAAPALDRARETVTTRVREVRDELAARAWQTVAWQPRFFPLVDAILQIATLSALNHRTLISRRLLPDGERSVRQELLESATSLLAEDVLRLDVTLLQWSSEAAKRVRAGKDLLTQAISDRALLRHAAPAKLTQTTPRHSVTGSLEVLVLLDPQPMLAPEPRVREGRIREHRVGLDAEGRFVLDQALRLKGCGEVRVTAMAAGSARGVDLLEDALSLGVDRAYLIDTEGRALSDHELVLALAGLVRTSEDLMERRFDLLLGAEGSASHLLPLARRLETEVLAGIDAFSISMEGQAVHVAARPSRSTALIEEAGPVMLLLSGSAETLRFTTAGWRSARGRLISVIEYTPAESLDVTYRTKGGASSLADKSAAARGPMDVAEAAPLFAKEMGLVGGAERPGSFEGGFGVADASEFSRGLDALALIDAGPEGNGVAGWAAAVKGARSFAHRKSGVSGVLVLVEASTPEADLRTLLGEMQGASTQRVGLLRMSDAAATSYRQASSLLAAVLEGFAGAVFYAGSLRRSALLSLSNGLEGGGQVFDGVSRLACSHGHLELTSSAAAGRLEKVSRVDPAMAGLRVICSSELVCEGDEVDAPPADLVASWLSVLDSTIEDPIVRALKDVPRVLGTGSLSEATFIIDVGYGVGSADGIEEVIAPLKEALERLGVKDVRIGATRKVTQDLGILPDECQIGQTGVPVDPHVMLAIGVSGAPQHLEYIGTRALIFAFNKDPEAPLMVLNESRPHPVVYPIVGDLFREVPKFVQKLLALTSDHS